MKTIKIGGLKTNYEERPVIKLTIKFNGDTFKDIPICLTNRMDNSKSNKSEILVSRSFMKLAGLSVDPANRYLLSLKDHADDSKKLA